MLPGGTHDIAAGPTELLSPSKRLLTVRDVAERLGVSRATVYKLCEEGTLPHIRVSNAIRIDLAALGTYLVAASCRSKP